MLISNETIKQIGSLNLNSNQPIIISGPEYTYKEEIAKYIISNFLGIDLENIDNYPYYHRIVSNKASIGIDEIRESTKFIKLAVPINKPVNRIMMISESERLTEEAQNALLKNLEESPESTLYVLTTKNLQGILPTVISRSRIIDVVKPMKSEMKDFFKSIDDKTFEQNYILSDGLPRLMEVFTYDADNEIKKDINLAKQILSSDRIHKLSYISTFSKKKSEALKIIQLIKQMSKLGTLSDNVTQSNKWKNILEKCIQTESRLRANSNLKLTLLDFFINI